MTDDGQAQNSLHANSSNCAGQMGWEERDRGPDLPRFQSIGFAMTKLCRIRPQPGMHF